MADGESYVQKGYVHIGIAVDSPVGFGGSCIAVMWTRSQLVQIAKEANELIKKALSKQLKPVEYARWLFSLSLA